MNNLTPPLAYSQFQHLIGVHAVDSAALFCAKLAKDQNLPIEKRARALVSPEALQSRIEAPAQWLNGIATVFQTVADWLKSPARADQQLASFLTAEHLPLDKRGAGPTVPSIKAGDYAKLCLDGPSKELTELGKTLEGFKPPAMG